MLRFIFALTGCFLATHLMAQVPDIRCYPLSKTYLRGDISNCFENTCAEADRAFRLGFWDDAASLYRAAKSCDDANQERRRDMNARIKQCRQKADEELRNAALEARMAARNAIATARAADAQDLLRKFDRTGAYRLADFAYEYIAPPKGANYPCAQAILDAWQYLPERYGAAQAGDFQVPFCYEAAIGLGKQCKSRFFTKNKKDYVAVLSRQNLKLYTWNLERLSNMAEQPIDSAFVDFDTSPNGENFAFFSEKEVVFRREDGRELLRLPWGEGFICRFSQSGDKAYIYSPQNGQIAAYRLDGRRMPQTRNIGSKSNRASNIYAADWGTDSLTYAENLGANLRDFRVTRSRLWLLYDEGILAYQEENAGEVATHFLRVFYFENRAAERPRQILRFCGDLSVICANDSEIWFFGPPSLSAPDSLRVKGVSDSRLLGVAKSGSLAASYRQYDAKQFAFYTHDVSSGAYVHGAIISEQLLEADFSSNLAWMASCTPGGVLLLWRLQESGEAAKSFIPLPTNRLSLSDEGNTCLLIEDDAARVFDADHWETPLAEIPFSLHPGQIAEWALAHRGDWVAFRSAPDSLLIYNWKRRKGITIHSATPVLTTCFNADQSLLAFSNYERLQVIETNSGKVKDQFALENADARFVFIGKTNQLLLVYGVELSGAGYRQLIREWDPGMSLRESVRLPQYSISDMAVSPSGGFAAFSNGSDIRIFRLDQLEEEYSAIRSVGQFIQSMTFMPNERTLAVSYGDGQIVLWNVADGKRIVAIRPTLSAQMHLGKICFIKNGSALRMLQFKSSGENRYTQTLPSIDVDPELIRRSLSVGNRQLKAFTSDQIREYELEEALSYPGNFERLAASEDLPLIRSFFTYYQEQAIGGNNIATVSEYCDKALFLYRRLDNNTRAEMRPQIVGMYADYAWKLLLRERIADAEKANRILVQEFGADHDASRIGGHLHLLRDNYSESARLFIQYLIEKADDEYFEASSGLVQDFRQLEEYGLLTPSRQRFICGLMGDLLNLEETCTPDVEFVYPALPAAVSKRWEAFKLGFRQEYCEDRSLDNLERALEMTVSLWQTDNNKYQVEFENSVIRLAEWHAERAFVEKDNLFAVQFLDNAAHYLRQFSPFKVKEKQRLYLVGRNRLDATEAMIKRKRLDDALQICEEGLAIGQELLEQYKNDPFETQFVKSQLVGELKLQSAYAHLYAGRLAEAAQAYKEAQTLEAYIPEGNFEGYLAYLRRDSAAMMLAYGNINSSEALSEVLYVLARLRESDAQGDMLVGKLIAGFRSAKPNVNTEEALFLRSDKLARTYHVQRRPLQALKWMEEAGRLARQLFDRPGGNHAFWGESYVNTLISRAYYSLFMPEPLLNEAIALSEKALHESKSLDETYRDPSLALTNLAHALLIRNGPGDRPRAIETYRAFLSSAYADDCPRMVLIRDWQELLHAGVRIPDLPGAIRLIFDEETERGAALKAVEAVN